MSENGERMHFFFLGIWTGYLCAYGRWLVYISPNKLYFRKEEELPAKAGRDRIIRTVRELVTKHSSQVNEPINMEPIARAQSFSIEN